MTDCSKKFLDGISCKAQFLSNHLWNNFTNKTIGEKFSQYILENQKNGFFQMKISVKDLAEYFDVSRPSLSRVIKNFLEENILEIATTLFEEKIKSSSQPFFPNAAKDIFAALMMHISRHANDEDHANNKYLRTCFDTFKVSTMKQILEMNTDLKSMRTYIEDEKSGQTLGVVSEMQQLVREIFVGNFKQKGNLSIREIVRNKGNQVVFVEYDLGIGQVLSPIYRIIFDLAIKEALCRTSNEGNVYFLLDEFRLLPHLKHIDDGVNFGRRFGSKNLS